MAMFKFFTTLNYNEVAAIGSFYPFKVKKFGLEK